MGTNWAVSTWARFSDSVFSLWAAPSGKVPVIWEWKEARFVSPLGWVSEGPSVERLCLAFGWFVPHTGGHVLLKPFALWGAVMDGREDQAHRGLGFLSLITEHSLGL